MTIVSSESEPLARVGDDVAVPWFPGRGGRRTSRAVAVCPMALKELARVGGGLTPHCPCQGFC
ncbi:MAG: hypothetical protein WAV05_11830 [Anaerolineales bacterium]